MNISIRQEHKSDCREVENLIREAFWNIYRPGCDEHLIVHNMRKLPAFIPELSLVACDAEKVIGNIIYSKAKIVDDNGIEYEVLCMGPVAVLPCCQNLGIGSLLMNHSIQKARDLGYKAIIIYGNPAYYHRFGFVNAVNYGIKTSAGENFDAFMALELYGGSLRGISGRFFYDKVFNVNSRELEEYEKNFPHKEKLFTDTQLK